MKVLKEMMKIDFWSIDVPLGCKQELDDAFLIIKLGLAALILNLTVVSTGRYICDIFPHWPFISNKLYPYYVAASVLHTYGAYIIAYTHCLIYAYPSFHIYCQILLLSEYFKQLKLNSEKPNQIEVNVEDYIYFGIKQHANIIR